MSLLAKVDSFSNTDGKTILVIMIISTIIIGISTMIIIGMALARNRSEINMNFEAWIFYVGGMIICMLIILAFGILLFRLVG